MSGALKLGTRGSRLARWQAAWVRDRLAERGARAELVVIGTRGDAEVDRPLHTLEGKGFFTREIEDALLERRIDVAVHSLKDLPTRLPDGLALAAVPRRADAADALVARAAGVSSLAALPPDARVGTSSLRRSAQVRYLRPDVRVVPLRGNVPTRVGKVRREGRDAYDAAVLAWAGLERLGLAGEAVTKLDPLEIMPAPGQGALGLEIRSDDGATRRVLAPLDDPESARAVAAERALLAALGGGCQAPVAAYAEMRAALKDSLTVAGSGMRLYGRVTAVDGSVQLTVSAAIDPGDPTAGGAEAARLLAAQGAERLLAR